MGAAVIVSIAAALYIFYTFDPKTQPLFPRCPFLLVTGYECPGCGSQRAIHSLLHFNIGAALRYNAFMVLALPYILLGIYLEYFGGKKRFPRTVKFFFGRWSAVMVLIVITAYWILRNLL
ncbi:DUF2752 domain-containing protein [Proteiniphilum sp.]|uniref:DUF2752 domain-containing protein n=1 Tax=Proteiniphilum sp. TaxID=1926877 RepID=UPI002B20EB76|nr:DUF2752 domain-containing protein [Proteiniphilum sp.]MEA4919029.1 DUF2752 domain-containing protein [Proteiniphilum sp.]